MNIRENDQKRTGTKKSLQPTGVFIGIRLQIFGQLQFDASDAISDTVETPGGSNWQWIHSIGSNSQWGSNLIAKFSLLYALRILHFH